MRIGVAGDSFMLKIQLHEIFSQPDWPLKVSLCLRDQVVGSVSSRWVMDQVQLPDLGLAGDFPSLGRGGMPERAASRLVNEHVRAGCQPDEL